MWIFRTGGLNLVRSRMRGIQTRLARTRSPLRESLEAIKDWSQDNIRSGGAKVGGWPPLATSTIARKQRGGWPLAPLVRTGRLRDDWTVRVTGNRGRLSVNAPYAVFHHRGTRRMPKRRFLPTERQAEDLIRPIWGRHVRVSIR